MSGCGGGSSSGKSLSDSEFVAQANADCANVYRQYANADLAQRAGVLTGGVAKLKELAPPPVKQDAFQRFLKAVEAEAGAWKEMTSGGGSSDLTGPLHRRRVADRPHRRCARHEGMRDDRRQAVTPAPAGGRPT